MGRAAGTNAGVIQSVPLTTSSQYKEYYVHGLAILEIAFEYVGNSGVIRIGSKVHELNVVLALQGLVSIVFESVERAGFWGRGFTCPSKPQNNCGLTAEIWPFLTCNRPSVKSSTATH